MKKLTTLLLLLSAFALGACAHHEPATTSTYHSTSTTSYSK